MPDKQNKNSLQGNWDAVFYSNIDAEICNFFNMALMYV